MNLFDFKYAFTIVGGGWGHIQDVYFISDTQVFYKKNFSYDEVNNHLDTMEFSCVIDLDTTNMDFKTHRNHIGCDAPYITMYKIKNGIDKKIWRVGDYDNSEAVSQIRTAVYYALRNSQN